MVINKKNILICWVGGNDLKATESTEPGPILATLRSEKFDSVELLYTYPTSVISPYLENLSQQVSCQINAHYEPLTSPINFSEIYGVASKHLNRLDSLNIQCSILLSPGTPAMQAVWLLLGKTKYAAKFYQSSIEQGVQQIEIPFDISAEYIPQAKKITSSQLVQLTNQAIPPNAAFNDILTRNHRMNVLKAQAQVLAQKDVPVLINGETGTGKELFARAIHNASPRLDKQFIAVNCGAFPRELVDSILFGHKKGAFTGAVTDKSGVFEQANGGTLFLDEFGELEPDVQVRLLRVLQEGTFTPVGGTQEQSVDVRIITATHRNLIDAIAQGKFREDLFFRIAVGVLNLPPLRERDGDISFLTDLILTGIAEKDTSLNNKNISVGARNVILKHPWRGNIRELHSTILRAAIWSQGDSISAEDMQQALFQIPGKEGDFSGRDISQGIDIQEIIGEITRQYISEALKKTNNNKTRAAELLGLKNYQTLNNWMEKYGIK